MPLPRRTLPGTNLSLSIFCYGLGDVFTLPPDESDRVLDAFVEAGGNFFDTAHVYSAWVPRGTGLSELSLADYLKRRGLKDAVVATKGGHPSMGGYRTVDRYLSPERIGADVDDSLGRLQVDTIDIYYLHRDDTRTPVAEVMDALQGEITRGRLRHLGASNWATSRIAEANAYALGKGRAPFVISQPCWSLADLRHGPALPVVRFTDAELEWHRVSSLAIAPYSPTAHGYFAAASERTDHEYGTPRNASRRARVQALAQMRDVTPSQLALAWLINHPFPVFPILGIKNLDRLRDALGAASIQLSPDDLAQLAG